MVSITTENVFSQKIGFKEVHDKIKKNFSKIRRKKKHVKQGFKFAAIISLCE